MFDLYDTLKAGGVIMTSKKPFLSFVIEEDLLERIDDYRFENRFESRAAAIKSLITIALEVEENSGQQQLIPQPKRQK